MAKISLDGLNDMQYDVLKEIGNIGAGNATTALSKMLNIKMDMSVPNVALVPFSDHIFYYWTGRPDSSRNSFRY